MSTSVWKRLKAQLGLMASDIPRGGTIYDICPKCGGGQSRDKSLGLTVSEDGKLLWNCFRASCGFKGGQPLWGVANPDREPHQKAPRPFQGELRNLGWDEYNYLWDKFGLTKETVDNLGWKYSEEYVRYWVPIFSSKHNRSHPSFYRGSILTNAGVPVLSENGPKSIAYRESYDQPFQGWFDISDRRKYPILVEDVVSAAKVAQAGFCAVALLGTNLSLDGLRDVGEENSEAILALDKDAFPKSLAYANKYRNVVSFTVWKLDLDLKYVTESRIREAYFSGKTNFSRV